MTDKVLGDLIAVGQSTQAKAVSAPSVEELCIGTPLYAPVQIDRARVIDLRWNDVQFDAYCVKCQKETTFRTRRTRGTGGMPLYYTQPANFALALYCSRYGHVYEFFFSYREDEKIEKIGQIPSIADISGADIRKYKPLLRGGYFEELTKANGLISHGIGIGSFTYLRRIFEKLINDHRAEHEKETGAPIDGFVTMRMEEKIAALKDVLPKALVRNRATYGILSKGIHELSEEECKLYFPVVRAAILQILEQDFEAREQKRREASLEAEIAAINATLKASGNTPL